jgi:membrane-bound serine protease (ClpP class)
MLEETRRIVRAFLDADVPVIVYVSPAAARAGSAGALITMSAHVAAMAPGSNIGAAHPVVGAAGDDPEAAGEELARKVENDVASLARAIAIERDRNVEWAEAAVRESVSATASEAFELGVIDLVIEPESRLLDALDGTSVRLASGEDVVLNTRDASSMEHEMTIQERVLTTLGDPNLAYALVMLGMIAIAFEFFQPGFGVAGGIGALLLVLGAIGLNMLPVRVGAVLLLVAALALFIAEMYVTSFGFLALAGVGCLFVGGALLVDRTHPELFADTDVTVSWGVVVPLALVLGVAAMALGVSLARVRRRSSPTGLEGLLHAKGVVIRATGAEGKDGVVLVNGERWQAISDEPLRASTPIRVIDIRGLILHVESHSGGVA